MRLLFVDDDPALGRLVQRQLSRAGYDVLLESDATSGLRLLDRDDVDAVVLDHHLPDQDGLVTLGQILARPSPPPVVFLTGTSESRVAVAALKAGASDYVVKDLGGEFIDLLDASIRSALAQVALRRDKEAAEREIVKARDRFEALAEERQALMREVNHRVGNSLQLVAAMLHMQAAASSSEETRLALADANRRVLAVAQVHRRLYASGDAKVVALDTYLASLIDDIRDSDGVLGNANRLSLRATPVITDPDTAVTVGVIVTELVIEAMKHAVPSSEAEIRVVLDPTESESRFMLRVASDDAGTAFRSAAPSGLNRTIIKAMAAKLNAPVDYDDPDPSALATLTFTLPEAT